MSHQVGLNPRPSDHQSNALTTKPAIAAAESTENLKILMYTVASRDPNPRGGGQLPNSTT